MAKSETSWKPGQSGNPDGRVKLPEDIKTAKRINKIELERLLNLYLSLTDDEIKLRQADTGTTQIERMIASIVEKGIVQGDQQRLNFLLDRLVGKVKEEIDVTVRPRPVIIERLDGSEVEMTTKDVSEIEE